MRRRPSSMISTRMDTIKATMTMETATIRVMADSTTTGIIKVEEDPQTLITPRKATTIPGKMGQ